MHEKPLTSGWSVGAGLWCGDGLAVIISSAQTSKGEAMIRRGQHGRYHLQF